MGDAKSDVETTDALFTEASRRLASRKAMITNLEAKCALLAAEKDELAGENQALVQIATKLADRGLEGCPLFLLVVGDPAHPLSADDQLRNIRAIVKIGLDLEDEAEDLYFTARIAEPVAAHLLKKYGKTMIGNIAREHRIGFAAYAPMMQARITAFFAKFPDKH